MLEGWVGWHSKKDTEEILWMEKMLSVELGSLHECTVGCFYTFCPPKSFYKVYHMIYDFFLNNLDNILIDTPDPRPIHHQ